jgi:hypothetical protein
MSYTDQQLSDFWYGPGGSATNIQPGAYVTMTWEQVRIATTPGMSGYLGPNWVGMLQCCQRNRLFGFADYSDSCAFGADTDPKKYCGNRQTWWIGPTKS